MRSGCLEIFYEPLAPDREMALLCDLSAHIRERGLIFEYREFGNVRLYRRNASHVTETDREAVEDWLDARPDILSHEVFIRPTYASQAIVRVLSGRHTPKQIIPISRTLH